MPTIKRIGAFRFFFVSVDYEEPPHIHVQSGERSAKFWLDPVALAHPGGFKAHELNRIARLVQIHQQEFLEAWNDFFGGGNR